MGNTYTTKWTINRNKGCYGGLLCLGIFVWHRFSHRFYFGEDAIQLFEEQFFHPAKIYMLIGILLFSICSYFQINGGPVDHFRYSEQRVIFRHTSFASSFYAIFSAIGLGLFHYGKLILLPIALEKDLSFTLLYFLFPNGFSIISLMSCFVYFVFVKSFILHPLYRELNEQYMYLEIDQEYVKWVEKSNVARFVRREEIQKISIEMSEQNNNLKKLSMQNEKGHVHNCDPKVIEMLLPFSEHIQAALQKHYKDILEIKILKPE